MAIFHKCFKANFWIVLLSQLLLSNTQKKKPTSILYLELEYDHLEYKVHTQKHTFYEAMQICASDKSGTLAKITNQKQQDYITGQIEQKKIGGKFRF